MKQYEIYAETGRRAGEMSHSVRCLPHKHEDMSSDPQQTRIKTDYTVCVYHSNTAKREQGGSLELFGQIAFAKSVRDPVLKKEGGE